MNINFYSKELCIASTQDYIPSVGEILSINDDTYEVIQVSTEIIHSYHGDYTNFNVYLEQTDIIV